MTEAEKTEQIARQCEAVAHQAMALANVHRDFARLIRAGAAPRAHDSIGRRSAALMEYLGDTLNGMDAVTDADEWMQPIFAAAQKLYPQS